MLKRMLSKHEMYLAITIAILSIVIGIVSDSFFTFANLFDLLQNAIVTGIFALGLYLVLVSGGIDVSFTAIAAFSMYVATKILKGYGFEGSILVAFLIAMFVGLLLGLINAFFISEFELPTLIVTLGTQNLFRGFLLGFIGTKLINNLPKGMIDFSRSDLLTVKQGRLTYGLPSAILILLFIIVITVIIVRYTRIGRGIVAMGGDAEAAQRIGFDTRKIKYFIYSYVGVLAGIGGVIHASIIRVANPFDLVGTELNVIAAVVLGGTRITGGSGSILGTLLGVALIVIINSSLILMGIPSYWQNVAVGIILLLSIGINSYRDKRKGNEAYA